MLAAFLTTILFSISAVTANRTTKFMPGSEANFYRLLCATLFLAAYAHSFGQGLSGNALGIFFVSGCIGFGVGDLALFQAYPRLGSRLTILLVQCLAAPSAALIEWLFLHTLLSWPQILAGLTILAGVALALSPSQHLNATPKQILQGALFGVLAGLCQGIGAVLTRAAYSQLKAAGFDINGPTAAYQRILGGVAFVAIFLMFTRQQTLKPSLPESDLRNGSAKPRINPSQLWILIVINALAGPALGVSCYQWALKTTPTGVVLPIVAMTPIVIIPFARVMEGERPTLRSLFGGVIAVIGVVALTMVSRR